MKDEEGKKQDFQTIAYQPKVWTTGAMHQHRKISAEFPWNWWSLTHRDEELGSVAYHTPYVDRKSCMCINHRFSELVCCTCTWVMRESAIFYVVDFYFILSWQNLHIYRGLWYSVTHSQSKSENKCDIYHYIWEITTCTNNSSLYYSKQNDFFLCEIKIYWNQTGIDLCVISLCSYLLEMHIGSSEYS